MPFDIPSRFALVAAFSLLAVFVAGDTTPDPAGLSVAILTNPTVDCLTSTPADLDGVTSCVRSTYVRWLEAAGVRVVPLHWDDPIEKKLVLLKQVNGVVFAGGSLDVQPAYYTQFWNRACEIVTQTQQWNAAGDPFFLLGICQGFQMVSSCVAGTLETVVDGFIGVDAKMLALNFTDATNTSRFLGSAPTTIRDALLQQPSTLNYHHEGVLPSSFAPATPLGDYFLVTSTNTDLTGREFVSTIEGREATSNVFGVQWHPEWPPFDWSHDAITKTPAAIEVSQWASRFVASRLALNNHSFASAQDQENVVIEQNPTTYQGWGRERFWIGGVPKDTERTSHDWVWALVVVGFVACFLAGAAVGRAIMKLKLEDTVQPYRRVAVADGMRTLS
jgi:gamma-glutamyl hydrolase